MKQDWLRVRISKEEKELIKKKADEVNMSISEYVRFVSIHGKVEVKIEK